MSTLAPLEKLLPRPSEATADRLLEAFLDYCEERSLGLYPAQEEAILEVFDGHHVVLATPTGSGKSMVALAACAKALAQGGRAFYTAPIKALVSEKFFELCRALGAANVGMMTGDASVNRDAPIICCTAEILAALALREGERARVDVVVMDEFHYYGDRDRGVSWQIPLITLRDTRFLLMSATLGDTRAITESLAAFTGAEVKIVRSATRPVPLEFEYRETPLLETAHDLLMANRAPVYLVHFTQRAASERAQDFMSSDILTKEEKQRVKDELRRFRFDTPFGKDLKRWVYHGVGVHHAGMLPKYRRMVEKLAQSGLLKLICGTDTLGVGVNVPIRTVVFTQLCKYDGEKTNLLAVRDFHQISGRAGRKGYDDRGWVVCQAPEHVIENKVAMGKASGDPKKQKKLVMKKPPDRGYSHWDEAVFQRLQTSEPERLASRFEVTHGMLLSVLGRGGREGCGAMKQLVKRSHESRNRQWKHLRHAVAIARSLRDTGILELGPDGARVHEDLQSDFSLNHAHALFVVEATIALDVTERDYALDVLSVVECTLEDPRPILERQLDALKTRAMQRMKGEGVEYDERIAELEKIDNPRPKSELLYGMFDEFRKKHPWTSGGISPKSVVRDMYEEGESFLGFVRLYGLSRSEGVLLRYLTDAYKVLVQTVPEGNRTPELEDILDWLGTNVRSIDASLLEEWERMREPTEDAIAGGVEPDLDEEDITANPKAFSVLIRNEVFRLVRALARRDYAKARDVLSDDVGDEWTDDRFEVALAPYFEAYGEIRTDPQARSPAHVRIDPHSTLYRVHQTLLDPDGNGDFFLDLDVDVDASRTEGRPILKLGYLGD